MMNYLKLALPLCFLMSSFSVQAITPVVNKKETTSYILDVAYPQGFRDANVNKAVKEFIEFTHKNFLHEIADDDSNSEITGKSGLNSTYSIPFEQNDVLSVRFNISVYHRGAAHPLNTVSVLNFIKGKQVKLADLFLPGTNYLKPISQLCSKEITAKDISDAKWIKEGTAPVVDNYNVWSFTPKGIDIIFDSYQVAAYVYGEQTVSIPLSTLSTLIKPEILKTVWNH